MVVVERRSLEPDGYGRPDADVSACRTSYSTSHIILLRDHHLDRPGNRRKRQSNDPYGLQYLRGHYPSHPRKSRLSRPYGDDVQDSEPAVRSTSDCGHSFERPRGGAISQSVASCAAICPEPISGD